MEKKYFLVFIFLFAGILIHLSSAAEPPSGHYEAPGDVFVDFIESVQTDLQKSKIVLYRLMSKRELFPLVGFRKLSACEKALNEHARMLPFYRPHNWKQIEKLESEIRESFLRFIRAVSFWFIRDTEALLDFVNLNKNMSLRTLFESTRKLSHSDSSLSYILREINALPFGLIMVNLDLGNDWNTTETRLNFSGEPISKVEINFDWFDIRSRLSFLREFLSKACKIQFFPKDNGFLEQLERLIISRMEKFVFNGEDASAFEIWYRDGYSHFSPFLSHSYIDNHSARLFDVAMLKKSVKAVELFVESLNETAIEVPSYDFTEISLFVDKFEYASFRLNTSDVLDKVEYYNSGLKRFLVKFESKILFPLYSGRRRAELLTFLKSGNLKLIHFVLKLLNARGSCDISIENDKVLPETIYFNAFQLIEYELYYETINTRAEWKEFKLFISNFANILERLPEVVPKDVYDGPKMPLTNYIANLRYLSDNAKFDEKNGIFDVNPLKTALSLIAETEKDSKYHCQVTLVIFYLIKYYERVRISPDLGYGFLLAMHSVHRNQSNEAVYCNFYDDIGNIRELLHGMTEAIFTKTRLDGETWRQYFERLLSYLQQRNDNDKAF